MHNIEKKLAYRVTGHRQVGILVGKAVEVEIDQSSAIFVP